MRTWGTLRHPVQLMEEVLCGRIQRQQHRRHVGNLILTGVLAGLAGATLMYLFDPIYGRRRRHILRDKSISICKRKSHQAAHFASDVSNRTRGMWHRASHLWEKAADDRKLAERVRSAIGHAAMHVGSVMVQSRDGILTLSGPVMEQEATAILRAAGTVRGVREVVDRLHPTSELAHSRATWKPSRSGTEGMDPSI